MSYTPLFLRAEMHGPVLIIGGGALAAAKAEALAGVGAHVEILAEKAGPGIQDLAAQHGFPLQEASYTPFCLEGKRIVVAATDNHDTNTQIAADCRARSILVNVVDNPELCDFIFPALVRRGPLQIAISSSGISPVLARLVKQQIEQLIPAEFAKLIAFLDDKKTAIRKRFASIQPRRMFYETLIRGVIAEEALEGNRKNADHLFEQALTAAPDANQAALYLIGAGPGHPELITVKAVRLLSQADVILYDRLVSPLILEQYARKDAQKIAVGKTRCRHLKKQDDIGELIETHLRKGRIVARLKGGDPGIYAHGAEEIAIAKKIGAPCQIVPGITAASGCAAYAGIPLTERDGASALRFITIYNERLQNEEFWYSLRRSQNETLVFYMSTPHYALLCDRLIKVGLSPHTPLLIVEQGTTPFHREYESTLSAFTQDHGNRTFASPCLLIVGDVVRWRTENAWKEPPQETGQYFTPLPEENAAYA